MGKRFDETLHSKGDYKEWLKSTWKEVQHSSITRNAIKSNKMQLVQLDINYTMVKNSKTYQTKCW